MSLEQALAANTAALQALTAAIQSQQAGAASVPQTAAPVQPQVAAPVPAGGAIIGNPGMPSLPTFAAPTPAPAPAPAGPGPLAPFTDIAGLTAYTMAAYQAMGAEKGARIQAVLQQLGYDNINNVKPEHFGNFFAGVEALKAGA